jgi:hypothetical protein
LHIIAFCEVIRVEGIPELGWKKFLVAEPEDMIKQSAFYGMGRSG